MRSIFNLLIIFLIGLGIGSSTAWYSIQKSHGIGAINIGQWSAWPFVGGSAVDPYTGAKVVADGSLPLGAAEGLAFEAVKDEDDALLRLECTYRLEGVTPPAKLWTLVAYNTDGSPVTPGPGGTSAKYSGNLMRFPDASFVINIGKNPVSGNWISTNGKGNFKLVMRLYDTPVTSTSGLIDPVMPKILQIGCES
ncbi:MAG: DUF1214 domain-containing protein [Rhizobiaceae bacterium]|nr:DUF1214 domain-containing protein [Rhizobiaceae bacterium]MBL4731166.1 DUF1214 domain-containing protein [Rhizobiaceae bacterium]